jgi:hypothetical protein
MRPEGIIPSVFQYILEDIAKTSLFFRELAFAVYLVWTLTKYSFRSSGVTSGSTGKTFFLARRLDFGVALEDSPVARSAIARRIPSLMIGPIRARSLSSSSFRLVEGPCGGGGSGGDVGGFASCYACRLVRPMSRFSKLITSGVATLNIVFLE